MVAKKRKQRRAVIVTTEHRGVFFGLMEDPSPNATEATLEDVAMVIYFGTTEGLGQLAATGPTDKTKLSARVPKWHLRKITSVLETSDVAASSFVARMGGAIK